MVMGRDKGEITGGTFLGKKARERVSMITVKKKRKSSRLLTLVDECFFLIIISAIFIIFEEMNNDQIESSLPIIDNFLPLETLGYSY